MSEIAKVVEQIDALYEKATKGPWKVDFKMVGDLLMSYQVGNSTTGPGYTVSIASARTADHELICAFFNTWPLLRPSLLAPENVRDTARLDFLTAHGDALSGSGYGADDKWWKLLHHDGHLAEGATPREAIDAALTTPERAK